MYKDSWIKDNVFIYEIEKQRQSKILVDIYDTVMNMCGVKTFQNFFYKINNIRNSKSVVKNEIVTSTHHTYDI